MRGLIDHLIRHRHEYFVEELGGVEGAQDSLATLTRQVAHASVGEQALVRAAKTWGMRKRSATSSTI